MFSPEELDTLESAARILASKRVALALHLQGLHPECYHAAVVSRTRNKIDAALRNYPDWRVIAKEYEDAR